MGTKQLAILLIGALALSYRSFAADFTVNSNEDVVDLVPGDGVCATGTGQCTLRAAVQETNALNGFDTINLPGGTYILTIPSDSGESFDFQAELFTEESGDLDVIDELTIIGSGSESTIIDAASLSGNARVFHIATGATVELRAIQMRGGREVGGGGGVFNAGTLALSECAVNDNRAVDVGFRGSGGGIYNVGTLTLNRTTVQHNTAIPAGAGIFNAGGDLFMSGGALYSNYSRIAGVAGIKGAGIGGGLVNNGGGTVVLSGVTIAWNRADFLFSTPSPGIENFDGQLTMDNSTVSDNYVGMDLLEGIEVGEIVNYDQTLLNNVTIGELGLHNEGAVQVQNTLIAGTCTGTIQSLGHNLIADATGCAVLGDGTGDLIDVYPRLGPFYDNGGSTQTRALLPGSPAIDAGDAPTCEALDQRGIGRPLDGDLDEQAICDIGAYEADGSEGAGPWLAAAVLPGSRSVAWTSPATAFATILNTGSLTATACTIAPLTDTPADAFLYQTTDPVTNEAIGTPNTPVDIAPGAGQTFLVAFLSHSGFFEPVVRFQFDCTNTEPAPVIYGVNTLSLNITGLSPDIIAASATVNNDGIVTIPGETGSGVFAVATVNVGAADPGPIMVSADTGRTRLPLEVFICETDPATSACLAPPAPEVTTTIESNATPTFGVFVAGDGAVPFDPANHRLFVYFKGPGDVIRGSTSVAVTTVP